MSAESVHLQIFIILTAVFYHTIRSLPVGMANEIVFFAVAVAGILHLSLVSWRVSSPPFSGMCLPLAFVGCHLLSYCHRSLRGCVILNSNHIRYLYAAISWPYFF